jgi:hypothetical protein
MADFPLKLRYSFTDGSVGPGVLADDIAQARSFLAQWREQGFTKFAIEDVNGQPVRLEDLDAPSS